MGLGVGTAARGGRPALATIGSRRRRACRRTNLVEDESRLKGVPHAQVRLPGQRAVDAEVLSHVERIVEAARHDAESMLAAQHTNEQERIAELEADRDRLSAEVQRLADELAAPYENSYDKAIAVRDWLRRKYETIEALNDVWQRRYGEFEEICPPPEIGKCMSPMSSTKSGAVFSLIVKTGM